MFISLLEGGPKSIAKLDGEVMAYPPGSASANIYFDNMLLEGFEFVLTAVIVIIWC